MAKKDKKDEEVVIIGEELEDIVSTAADKPDKDDKEKEKDEKEQDEKKEEKDKDKDKEKEEKPLKVWKTKVKRGLPIKWIVFKIENIETNEYFYGVELYDGKKKKGYHGLDAKLARGKMKKMYKRETIASEAVEDDAYAMMNELVDIDNEMCLNEEIPKKRVRTVIMNRKPSVDNKVTIDGVEYESMRDAIKSTNKNAGRIRREQKDLDK